MLQSENQLDLTIIDRKISRKYHGTKDVQSMQFVSQTGLRVVRVSDRRSSDHSIAFLPGRFIERSIQKNVSN